MGGTVLLLRKSNNPVKEFMGKSVHNFGLFVDLVVFFAVNAVGISNLPSQMFPLK